MSDTVEVAATGAAADAVTAHVPTLVADSFASRLFAQDPTLWGPDAESEASVRLGWVGLPRSSRPLVGEVEALRADLHEEILGPDAEGSLRVVLCGMGGSSLAPEVICATAGVDLVVLDSSHPDQVRAAVEDQLERTVVVVSSKSGSTVETDSQRRAFVAAFEAAGIDPTRRLVIVTDPGSPMDTSSREAGYRVVNADPHVGGRYSALTAFGLVPSGLAGVDLGALLDEAEICADLLAADDEANPGLRLGAAMGGTDPLRDKLVLVEAGSGIPGFPSWAEQLIAESTGKDGTGLLPVVVDAGPGGSTGGTAPEVADPPADATLAWLVSATDEDADDADSGPAADESGSSVSVAGSLGAQLLLWEVATAVAGRLLGIDPFDQPDVESAKTASRALLEDPPETTKTGFRDGAVSVEGIGDWLGGVGSLRDALASLLAHIDRGRGYLAVMAYLDRIDQADLEDVRGPLARQLGRPVTFGWGPRFLHSTGQFHKGGPEIGIYLQITADPVEDLAIPGRDFGFATLIAAQAAGDAQVLADKGRPVLRVHLHDLDAGLSQLRQALLEPAEGAGA